MTIVRLRILLGAVVVLAAVGVWFAGRSSPSDVAAPVYLGVVAGEGTQALSTAAVRVAVVFVGGFSVVFVSLGALAGGIGNALGQQADVVARVGGAVVVAAQEDAWRGASLPSVYSLGVGVPFVAALAAASWPSFATRYARVGHRFELAGGVVLGVFLAAGWYNHLIDPLIPK